jgi:esterase/lipase
MEKEIKIRTPDKKAIYGILRGSLDKPVVVLVHGFSGNMNEAMHYNAARYFEKAGFSCFRFNLYSWQKDARKMHECTFSTHGRDIDTVLGYLQKRGAKKIFIAGHSYGFPSILHSSNRGFRAVASWDGSILPTNNIDVPLRSKKPKGRILNEGYFVIASEEMAKDSHSVKTLPMLKTLGKPVIFITVNDDVNGNLSGGKRMFKTAKSPKALVIVKGGTHNFTEDGKQEELYASTVKWFKKYN